MHTRWQSLTQNEYSINTEARMTKNEGKSMVTSEENTGIYVREMKGGHVSFADGVRQWEIDNINGRKD